MNRYVIQFSKEGDLRYISHLDLLRLFKRSFKRAGIKLVHSQGFNPHPKMSFAQPLSLGYSSTSEYIEFDTIETFSEELILEKISAFMPEEISVYSCRELQPTGKSLAALTVAAAYEICIPTNNMTSEELQKLTLSYLAKDEILVKKHQKKSNKDVEVNIKPMIHSFEDTVYDNNIMITAKLAAGSTENLSPEMVLSSFCEFAALEYDRAEVMIQRKEIYFSE